MFKVNKFLEVAVRIFLISVVVFNGAVPVALAGARGETADTSPAPGVDFSTEMILGETPYSGSGRVSILSEEIAKQAQEVETELLQIELSAEPAIYIEGKPIIINWRLVGGTPEQRAGLSIVVHPAEGVQPVGESNPLREDGSLIISPKSNAGSTVWKVSDDAELPLNFSFEVVSNGKILNTNAIPIGEALAAASPGQKTRVTGYQNRVNVDIPANAFKSSLLMDIRYPGENALPGASLSWNPVEIIAVDGNSQKNVTTFDTPITIQIQYDEKNIFDWDERDLSIFYYDPETEDWFPMETVVDTEANTLTVQSDHLTVFDYKANNWQSYMVPTVDFFKTADFTGAGTYQINMWTPPAPGGLQPTVTLSYNSQVIDESSAYTQASWVGMGWDLDPGMITRTLHGTDSDWSDDTYSISIGGVSSQLLPVRRTGDIVEFHATDQTFMKVESNDATYSFTAWTKDGTKYEFTDTTDNNYNQSCSTSNNYTWRWGLTKVTDVHGNTLNYTYEAETKPGCQNEIAVYPKFIYYGDPTTAKYRIYFEREARTDYQVSWTSADSRAFYGTWRLKSVHIQRKSSGWQDIKRYDLSYAPNNSANIYPNFSFSAGGKTLTLVGVQEFGSDGSALPAVTFTYGDKMHLTTVNNGQGGSVSMDYTAWQYYDDINKDLRTVQTIFQTGDCAGGAGPSPTWTQVSGKVRCDGSLLLQVGDAGLASVGHRAIPENMIKPSAQYKFIIDVRAIQGTASPSWGIRETQSGSQTMLSASGVDQTGGEQSQSVLSMPVGYRPNKVRLRLECDNCFFRSFEFTQYVILYRVTSRTVTIQPTGVVSTSTYDYDNASPASVDNSAAVATGGPLYTKKLREFRGHAMSQMTAPNGLTTATWFWQADGYKGRAHQTLALKRDLFDGMESFNASNWTKSGGTHTPVALYQKDFDNSIKSTNGAANWNVSLARSSSTLSHGDVAVAHVRLSGSNAQAEVGLVQSGQFVGLTLGNNAVTTSGQTILNSTNFKKDEWYGVVFFLDAGGNSRVRIWQLDNPNNFGEGNLSSMSGNWRFRVRINNGSVYTDSYFEGKAYSQTFTRYARITQYDTTTGNDIPDILGATLMTYKDLAVHWVRVNWTESRTYDGNASYIGTKQEYTYADQYGNLLSMVESGNNGSGWAVRRKTDYEYTTPNTSKYIVSLPSKQTMTDASDTLLAETRFYYDGKALGASPTKGNLTKQRVWAGGTDYAQSDFTYDAYGNRLTQTVYTEFGGAAANPSDWSKQTTTTEYDTSGYNTYPVRVYNDLGHDVVTEYNYNFGLPKKVTDANGSATSATYDGFGRLLTITAPGDTGTPTLSVTYHDDRIPFQVDLVQTVSASAAIRLSRFYDGAGREIQTQTANAVVNGSTQNVVVDTQYNNMGQAVKKTMPYTVSANGSPAFVSQNFSQPFTETAYDDIGRVVTTTAPNQTAVEYAYSRVSLGGLARASTTTITDPKGNPTTTTTDVWGRTVSVTPPTGPGVSYTYDAFDRLTHVTRAGNITQIEYDKLGRKIWMNDPDMGYWEYAYDALGNLTKQTDAKGQVICLYYDALNRLDGKIYSASGSCGTPVNFDVDFNYDEGEEGTNGKGRRTSMSDASGSTAWTYDPRGRLSTETKVIDAQSYTTSWSYNSGDLPILMVYPDDETVIYGYNTDGTLKSVKSQTGGEVYLNDMKYDEAGRLKLIQYGNNIINKTFDYFAWNTADMGGLLSGQTAIRPSNQTPLQNLSYTYDRNGNVMTITDALFGPQTQNFNYDALNRITSAEASGGTDGLYSESYAYDSAGRLLTKNGVNYTYGDAAHKHAVTSTSDQSSVNSYQYDANGNMIVRDVGGQKFDLVYDEENRLTGVTAQGVQIPPTPTSTLPSTVTPSITPTFTETLLSTEMPEESPTPTPILGASETPGETATPIASPLGTETPEGTPTPSETPEETLTPTGTPEETPTPSETPEETLTPTETPEETPTPLGTETPEETPTPSETPEETSTPEDTPTPSETAEPTATDTAVPTVTSTPIPAVFANAEFVYDGDGKRVKSVMTMTTSVATTYFVGTHYEVTGSTVTKYYYAGSQRIAMRKDGTLNFIVGDHLGSTSLVTDASGNVVSEMRYKAWGEVRHASGSEATKYQYTGQYSYTSDFGLHFYNARWYDSSLSRFAQADTIIPSTQGVQGYDRYAYTNNNPVRYTDPSGHDAWWCEDAACRTNYYSSMLNLQNNNINNTNNSAVPSTATPTLNQFEEKLTSYATNTGNNYGVPKEKEAEASFHITQINSYIFKYANAYKSQTGFSWRPETLAYFYATLIVESQFGTAMIGDMTETGDQYYARGYIQLTGEDNYLRMGEKYGVNLIDNPDLVVSDLELSARIAMNCMIAGSCTGYKLDDFYYGESYNFVGARDIVNPGSPSAQDTALIAQDILPIVQQYWNIFGLP